MKTEKKFYVKVMIPRGACWTTDEDGEEVCFLTEEIEKWEEFLDAREEVAKFLVDWYDGGCTGSTVEISATVEQEYCDKDDYVDELELEETLRCDFCDFSE